MQALTNIILFACVRTRIWTRGYTGFGWMSWIIWRKSLQNDHIVNCLVIRFGCVFILLFTLIAMPYANRWTKFNCCTVNESVATTSRTNDMHTHQLNSKSLFELIEKYEIWLVYFFYDLEGSTHPMGNNSLVFHIYFAIFLA